MVNRGAHFKQKTAGFSWVIEILNDFSQEFQKCKNFQDRTMPLDAKACLASLSIFVEQAKWAVLVRQGALSDQKG